MRRFSGDEVFGIGLAVVFAFLSIYLATQEPPIYQGNAIFWWMFVGGLGLVSAILFLALIIDIAREKIVEIVREEVESALDERESAKKSVVLREADFDDLEWDWICDETEAAIEEWGGPLESEKVFLCGEGHERRIRVGEDPPPELCWCGSPLEFDGWIEPE